MLRLFLVLLFAGAGVFATTGFANSSAGPYTGTAGDRSPLTADTPSYVSSDSLFSFADIALEELFADVDADDEYHTPQRFILDSSIQLSGGTDSASEAPFFACLSGAKIRAPPFS